MRYLSHEWIEAADRALRDTQAAAPLARVVIDQHVDDLVSYRVTIEQNACSMMILDSADAAHPTTGQPDAVFRQSATTARAVAQGATDAHQAFLLGKIRFTGDINILIERRQAFTWLETTLAPLLAATSFDEEPAE